jgi:hypothetical protein
MMNKGDSGSSAPPSTTAQTQTKEIPVWAQDSAIRLLRRGEELSNKPYESYQGQRIAGMDERQTQGLNQIQNRALSGSPEENAARQNYTATMSGNYLSPGSNPYLKATVQQGMDDVSGKINSQFGGSNYGTTAHQETLTRNLGQVANDAYGQNYVNERNNQMKQSALLPQYGNIDYSNAQQLTGVGDIYRQESQDVLNNQYSDWAAGQNQPYRQLDVLGNALGASVNGQGSVQSAGYQSNPYTANRYASAIGGGLAGYGLGSAIGGEGSYGGAVGAGLGGLLGYMGS